MSNGRPRGFSKRELKLAKRIPTDRICEYVEGADRLLTRVLILFVKPHVGMKAWHEINLEMEMMTRDCVIDSNPLDVSVPEEGLKVASYRYLADRGIVFSSLEVAFRFSRHPELARFIPDPTFEYIDP